jgi:Flp pilus assembly pilin Flp
MHQINLMKVLLAGRMHSAQAKAARNERGASAVEWVVITALLIGIAVAVGYIIMQKLTAKANSLNP